MGHLVVIRLRCWWRIADMSKGLRDMRGGLYAIARLLGDLLSLLSGAVGKRAGRRIVGRAAGKGIGRMFK